MNSVNAVNVAATNPLAELTDRAVAETPPKGHRYWLHRAALRSRLREIINPETDYEAYAPVWRNLLRAWSGDGCDAPQHAIEGLDDTNHLPNVKSDLPQR